MLNSLPVTLAVAAMLGFLSGLGVGGGSLLMLWLTVVLGMGPQAARGINLLFFIPSALIACFFRWKQGVLDLKAVLPAMLAGCCAAGLCAWLSLGMELSLLKKLFGGLLILTGLREILCKE